MSNKETKTSEQANPSFPFSIELELSQEDIDDIMCSALEGGICYWCDKAEVIGEYLGEYGHEQISRGGTLLLYDREEDEKHELTRDKFIAGLQLFFKKGNMSLLDNDTCSVDPGDIDAIAADTIIQYAIFGDLIYG